MTVNTEEAPALTEVGLKAFVIVAPSVIVTVLAVTATGLHIAGVVVLHTALLGEIGNELVYVRPEGVFWGAFALNVIVQTPALLALAPLVIVKPFHETEDDPATAVIVPVEAEQLPDAVNNVGVEESTI